MVVMQWRFMLGNLTDNQVHEAVKHYKDFADLELDNQELLRCCQGDAEYPPALLYKVFFWYIYNKQVPGFNGVLKLK